MVVLREKKKIISSAICIIILAGVMLFSLRAPKVEADLSGTGGMSYWVATHDYTSPIYYNARGINGCNYIMNGPMSKHVNSVYVHINNNWNSATRNFEELGWAWDYNNSTTKPYYFWALMINGQYYGGPNGLIGPAPRASNTQLQIYMAYPTNTPWAGGYLWNYLINNQLVAQLEGANSRGCAHISSERNVQGTSPSNYAHFWDLYSMRSTLGQWQHWGTMKNYYSSYWDSQYKAYPNGSYEVYVDRR